MNNASSGPRRGYIPNTAGRQQIPQQQWQQVPPGYYNAQNQQPPYGGYYAPQQPQQAYYQPQQPANGAQRGYTPAYGTAGGKQKTKKKARKKPRRKPNTWKISLVEDQLCHILVPREDSDYDMVEPGTAVWLPWRYILPQWKLLNFWLSVLR